MLMRKKKVQKQDDGEKMQELLQTWNIQLPEKEIPKPEILYKPETKKEDKKLKLSVLTTGNPELDKKFKQEAIQYMQGTVRMYSPELFVCIAVLIIFGLSVMYQVFVCFSVLAFAAAAFLLWYASRWELTFDGSTNRLSFRSLTCQEIHFHASEIESLQIKSGFPSLESQLILNVHGREIKIFLGISQSWLTGQQRDYFGGSYHSKKILQYFDFYQSLHGKFSTSGVIYKPSEKEESSPKEELMQMLAQYQKQIEEKNKNQNPEE